MDDNELYQLCKEIRIYLMVEIECTVVQILLNIYVLKLQVHQPFILYFKGVFGGLNWIYEYPCI